MISRRLTQSQKNEILEGYRLGASTSDLACKFNCSSNTINRTVKALASDDEYKLLKETRSKIGKFGFELSNEKREDSVAPFAELENNLIDHQSLEEDLLSNNSNEFVSVQIEDQYKFEVIAPLESSFDFDHD